MRASTKLVQEALLAWVGPPRLGVAASLTFRPSLPRTGQYPEPLTARHAQSCVAHYLRRLDRAAFGNKARSCKQVGAISVREGSEARFGKHLHYHLVLDTPEGFTPEAWAEVARQKWVGLEWASPEQNRFDVMWSDGWLNYIFKTRDKPNYFDAMDIENWRLVKR